jgi:UDP-glucose 4-epimerase
MPQNKDLHLVTGADGFIGSHLVEALIHLRKKEPALSPIFIFSQNEMHI